MRQYYSYNQFLKDINILKKQIKDFRADTYLAVARGGLTIAHFLAIATDMRQLFTLNSIHYNNQNRLDYIKVFNIPNLSNSQRVLIIDDIVDSGESMEQILKILCSKYPHIQFKIASIFYKDKAKIIPDFKIHKANCWIDFFWECDI